MSHNYVSLTSFKKCHPAIATVFIPFHSDFVFGDAFHYHILEIGDFHHLVHRDIKDAHTAVLPTFYGAIDRNGCSTNGFMPNG